MSINKIRLACFLFALFIGSVVYSADMGIGQRYFDIVRSFPLGDKISHFCLMGIMAALANLAARGRLARFGPASFGMGTAIVAVVVLAEEISQIWVPGRNFELFDLLADFLGIACGAIVATRYRRKPEQSTSAFPG
jgi:VanZ family protein